MNKNYTLKELADIGAKAGHSWERDWSISTNEAFTKAILDAIGYEFPKDEEREAFERWQKSMLLGFGGDQYSFEKATFEAWKAGREELRRAQSLDKQPAEPAWIPWDGGECPLGDTVKRWEYKVRANKVEPRGEINPRHLRWTHTGGAGDIVAYRVWEG